MKILALLLPIIATTTAFQLVSHHVSRCHRLESARRSSTTSSLSDAVEVQTDAPPPFADCTIIGGGPAGLLSAVMFAQKYPSEKVIVYERLDAPPDPNDEAFWSDVAKFYLIGLNFRGQKALAKFGVWDDVAKVCTAVVGRKDWAPDAAADEGVERIFTDRPYDSQVLPRDKLVGVLHKHILEKYANQIEVKFGYEVTPVDFGKDDDDATAVQLRVSKCETNKGAASPSRIMPTGKDGLICDTEKSSVVSTNLLIAAEGAARTIANAIEEQDKAEYEKRNSVAKALGLGKDELFRVTRYEDDNQRIYKSIPMKMPDEWRHDLNYSTRTKGSGMNLDALPADDKGNYCAILLMKKDDDLAAPETDPEELRKRFDDLMPQFSPLIDDDTMKLVATKPPSFLPSFRYSGPRLHHKSKTLILGDCAHTVKPYFGLGANCALEDISILADCLDEASTQAEAVKLFTSKRASESKALVQLSRELDRPGVRGAFSFIIPLIMDAVSHKFAPRVFAPNTISMLNKEGITFQKVRRRKRLDRFLQLATLSLAGTALCRGVQFTIATLARWTKQKSSTVTSVVVGTAITMFVVRKFSYVFRPGIAAADVLARTNDKIAGNDRITSKEGENENFMLSRLAKSLKKSFKPVKK